MTDEECANGYAPSREELNQLVKYWAEQIVELEYGYFLTDQFSRSDSGLELHAWSRIRRAAILLGEEEVGRIVSEVRTSYGEKQDKELWEIFTRGTPEQRHAVSEEMHRRAGAWYEIRRLGEKTKTA
jgi:hypothetical protein